MSVSLYYTQRNHFADSSKLFLSFILSNFYIKKQDPLVFLYNQWGKPFLRDFPEVHFNISHTHEALICAISDSIVGVDIEKMRKVKSKLVKHFFTKEESAFIYSQPTNINSRFTRIWTMKEAYLKRLGKGFSTNAQAYNMLEQKDILSINYKNYYIACCSDTFINETIYASDKRSYIKAVPQSAWLHSKKSNISNCLIE